MTSLNLANQKILIAKDSLNADTLVLKRDKTLSYSHTGLGVKFSGTYKIQDNQIRIRIVDYKRQYGKNIGKEKVMEFYINRSDSNMTISRIIRNNRLFDKIRVSSTVDFE